MVTTMTHGLLISLNGHSTSDMINPISLVKKKAESVLRSSGEYNYYNAVNMNFGAGNLNNNNKYNTNNYARAVAALEDEEVVGWLNAYDDCLRNKYTSKHTTRYRMNAEYDIVSLAAEIKAREYKPRPSTAFIVTKPKLREVYAADFRDRIVQHWIIQRINPFIEERFVAQGNVSYNCRPKYGTLAAVTTLTKNIEEVTENYTKEAWIGKYDIKSFFMSIDVNVLWELLEPFIREHYHGKDFEDLLYATEVTIFHRPQFNCYRVGVDLWPLMEPSKILINAPHNVGMPIGNITSQILANFYLSYFDDVMIAYCSQHGGKYIRFVDDFVVVLPCKHDVLEVHTMASSWLHEHLHLTLHKNKVYIQPARHGVIFVGSVIMPHRTYLINRTYGSMRRAIMDAEKVCGENITRGELDSLQATVNSYLGFTQHTSSFHRIEDMFRHSSKLWNVFAINPNLSSITLLKQTKQKLNYGIPQKPRVPQYRGTRQPLRKEPFVLYRLYQFQGRAAARRRRSRKQI